MASGPSSQRSAGKPKSVNVSQSTSIHRAHKEGTQVPGRKFRSISAQSAAEMETLGNSNINCEKGAASALSLISRHIFSACWIHPLVSLFCGLCLLLLSLQWQQIKLPCFPLATYRNPSHQYSSVWSSVTPSGLSPQNKFSYISYSYLSGSLFITSSISPLKITWK